MNIDQITKLQEIHDLRWPQILEHTHVITGPNGRCMCGVYDGIALTCKQIISMHQPTGVSVAMEHGDGSDY